MVFIQGEEGSAVSHSTGVAPRSSHDSRHRERAEFSIPTPFFFFFLKKRVKKMNKPGKKLVKKHEKQRIKD